MLERKSLVSESTQQEENLPALQVIAETIPSTQAQCELGTATRDAGALPTEDGELGSEELAELVHSIVALEDQIIEACEKTDTVFDWVAKGGRSLGLD